MAVVQAAARAPAVPAADFLILEANFRSLSPQCFFHTAKRL